VNNMKVAILTTHWIGSHGTGVPRYIMNLVKEFEKDDELEVSVLYMHGNDRDNYKIHGSKYSFPFRAVHILHRFDPDVIYMHVSWYFLLSGVIFRFFKKEIKLVSTIHSDPSRLSLIAWKIMNYLLNCCDCVTYVSQNLRVKIQQIWAIPIMCREEITYAGVTAQSVTNKELEEFNAQFVIPEKSIVLLMQSSPIADVKADGTKILMQSVKTLLPYYPEILLIITGTGPYLDELRKYAVALGIQDVVIFTGWVDNPFVPLTLCDIYTHISLGEGLPLALLEAMSIGKPIIATPVGGIPEVIDSGRNGVLVEPNVDKVAQAINTLLNDKNLRTTLGYNAYVDSKKYTWEKCANKFIEIFKGRY
jgi:glycosyltransferase involved in cell wall biosynthesis